MPFGSIIKDIFHHTIHLSISFSKISLFRLRFCCVVMQTDKCTYGKLIVFAFYQPTEIATCSNNSNGFVFPGQPYTCTCAQCCAELHRNRAEPPGSSPLITLQVRYGKLDFSLHKNLFTSVNICYWFPVFWAYNTHIILSTELHAMLIFVSVAQINFKAILDNLSRKVYAIFLITVLWSICSYKLNFLNKAPKYSLICQQNVFLQLHNHESFQCTIHS